MRYNVTYNDYPRPKADIQIPNHEIIDTVRGNLDKIDMEFFAMEMDLSLDSGTTPPRGRGAGAQRPRLDAVRRREEHEGGQG